MTQQEKIKQLVYAILNDGKLNGIETPQEPWETQIDRLVTEARIDELTSLQHKGSPQHSYIDYREVEYRLNQLEASLKGEQK